MKGGWIVQAAAEQHRQRDALEQLVAEQRRTNALLAQLIRMQGGVPVGEESPPPPPQAPQPQQPQEESAGERARGVWEKLSRPKDLRGGS